MKSPFVGFLIGFAFNLTCLGQTKTTSSHSISTAKFTPTYQLTDSSFQFTCYFDFNETRFVDSLQLRTWINSYLQNASATIQLNSFTDTIGSVEYNTKLAQSRLETIEKMIPTNHVKIIQRKIIGENYSLPKNYSNPAFRKVSVVLILENQVQEKPNQLNARLETFSKATTTEAIHLNIQFVGGEDVYLDETSMLEVTFLVQFLKENPHKKAFIRGHVCCENDLELSFKRAFAVYNDLHLEGIEESRISFQGFGNTLPISPEFDEASRQLNRRVDVIFSDMK